MVVSGIMTVLGHLQNVKKTGTGFTAKCPVHDDKINSLSVSTNTEGSTLIHCHAGCDPKHILEVIGLSWNDLFPSEPKGLTIEAAYPYVDEAGELLYQVVRTNPKSFRVRRPGEHGTWIWNLTDTRRVLYHLQHIISSDPQEPIFIVEGEKDVETLEKEGLTATTSPGGAGKWRPEYSESLRGRKVVILPDNDPPGQAHAKQVTEALKGIAKTVQILQLPGLPPHGDTSDWLGNGNTKENLITLVKGRKPQPINLLEAARHGIQPIPWLMPLWLTIDDVAILAGAAYSGKSTTAYALAYAISSGTPWLGLQPASIGPVLIIDEEQGPRTATRLLLRMGNPNPNLLLYSANSLRLDSSESTATLEEIISDHQPKLIILDSIQQLFGATEENSATDTGLVYKTLFSWRDRFHCAILLIHHRNKTGTIQRELIELVRGSSTHGTQASTVWLLARVAQDTSDLKQAKRREGGLQNVRILCQEPDGPNGNITLTSQGAPTQAESGLETAQQWLVDYLKPKSFAMTPDIIADASAEGIPKRNVQRALQILTSINAIHKPGRGTYTLRHLPTTGHLDD